MYFEAAGPGDSAQRPLRLLLLPPHAEMKSTRLVDALSRDKDEPLAAFEAATAFTSNLTSRHGSGQIRAVGYLPGGERERRRSKRTGSVTV